MDVAASTELDEQDFITVDVILNSRSANATPANVLIFRLDGRIYAYVNHCMHMQRPLNCVDDAIFDAQRRWLRCSMHGFIFEPRTGVCKSPVCEGQALKAVKVTEVAGRIVLTDKKLQLVAVRRRGDNHD